MIVFPNAKINIGLQVISRRSDGYHNLQTVLYPVSIQDALEVVESPELRFSASGIGIPGHANENLCLRAYELLKADFDLPPVHIHLHKNIPIGAGLGGGSSDAAFFIKLMNEKFGLALNDSSMQQYARQLGADCAFFIKNRPVYAYGKGDEFQDISLDLSAFYIVLVMPPVHVSTGEAYRGIEPAAAAVYLPEVLKLAPEEWKHTVKNDFEVSVFRNHRSIRGVKAALYEAGALYASMSGSGASVFGVFSKETKLPELEEQNSVFYGV